MLWVVMLSLQLSCVRLHTLFVLRDIRGCAAVLGHSTGATHSSYEAQVCTVDGNKR